MAAVTGRPLQADREQLLRNYTVHRINQEFAHALKDLPQAQPLDMVGSPASNPSDAFEALACWPRRPQMRLVNWMLGYPPCPEAVLEAAARYPCTCG